jgi:DNA-directed RNA polymerase specialized sigma subunit
MKLLPPGILKDYFYNLKKDITKILFDQGYILNYKFEEDGPQGTIKIALKYNPQSKVNAIKSLPEREQYIMGMYYEHDMNLKEIAAVLGVTESRVCQLHSQSIARLRAKMRSH